MFNVILLSKRILIRLEKLSSFENIRNFGIIAHIDAGKTTTTERILYLTGTNYRIGEVDEGTTTTDWMEEEKERGITITSAAVTCNWNNNTFHIIDTPGHVDFTAEVQRSLRVLDGAVVVLCGVAGVQTQTETVWKQADNFNLSRIIFINKLDRTGANFENVLTDINEKLKIKPLILNIPYYENDVLTSIIDIIKKKKINYAKDGNVLSIENIPENYKTLSQKYRDNLIDILTSHDDNLLELALEGKITEENLITSIRTGTLKKYFIPVLCGASFKNIGVTELLDAIGFYLPSPDDRNQINALNLKNNKWESISTNDKNPVLYVFKVQYHREKGPLAFTRIYIGKIKNGDTFYNPRTKKRERVQDLLKIFASDFERIEEAVAGDIVIIVGTKETVTGDTLCSEGNQIVLERLTFPEPVIFVSIEPKNTLDLEKLNIAKQHLLLEDPTIKFKDDNETGQNLIGGMGELHIEIFLERIKREYGVDLKSGSPQVAYRETPSKSANYTFEFDKKISGNIQHATITLMCNPKERNSSNEILFDISKKNFIKEELEHIELGINNSLLSGPNGAYNVVDCEIVIKDVIYDRTHSSPLALEAAANICTGYLLRETETILLEPVMKIEIDVPEIYTGNVIGDLQSRGGIILDILKKISEDKVLAKCPLKKMFGYSTNLRSITQGKGNFSMEFLEFDKM